MSKSLEALESLISTHINIQNGTNMIFNTSKILEELNIIKQDLERLEDLKKENQEWKEEYERLDRDHHSIYLDCCDLETENQKLKKAIFVVYMKAVDLELFEHCCDLKDYNSKVSMLRELTQQEYDLLKEALQ